MIFQYLKSKAMLLSLLAAFVVGAFVSLAAMQLRMDKLKSDHRAALTEKDKQHTKAMGALRDEHQVAFVQAADAARTTQEAITTKYENALNDAQARQQALRHDLGAARTASTRLRDQVASTNSAIASGIKLPQNSSVTTAQYALAASELLASCTEEYQSVAEQADGHASDVRTLKEAWPQSTPETP